MEAYKEKNAEKGSSRMERGKETDKRPFVSAVVTAAGASTRMGGTCKQLMLLRGMPVLARTLVALQQVPDIQEIVIVAREEEIPSFRRLCREHQIDKVSAIVPGGATRQQSAALGFAHISDEAQYVAVHDGARPLVRPERVEEAISAAVKTGAATLAVPVKDTIKLADREGQVQSTPDRRFLWSIQTPQVFSRPLYRKALDQAEREHRDYTDDCQLAEGIGAAVQLVPGDYDNIKITTPEDLRVAEEWLSQREGQSGMKGRGHKMRIGHGYDVHRLVEGRPLIVGGVAIPFDKGLLGHSDADVLAHAVSDALLGAAGLGDIGGMFPDDDPATLGADSLELLRQVTARLSRDGWHPVNIDATVIAQSPKMKPYISAMRDRLADACGIEADAVNVKATTEESLGFTGAGEGMAAHAVCLIERC